MIITDIAKIEKLSKQKEGENWQFRAFLKGTSIPTKEIDTTVHRLNKEVSSKIDCTACANCCKIESPTLDEEDIVTFAKGLGISSEQLQSQYLVEDWEKIHVQCQAISLSSPSSTVDRDKLNIYKRNF